MLAIRPKLARRYEARLAQQNLTAGQHPRHRQGPRSYLDLCGKLALRRRINRVCLHFRKHSGSKHQSEFKGKKRARPTDRRMIRSY